MALLTDEQVDAALPDLDGWERAEGALRRSIKFPSFLAGIDVVEVAPPYDHAEVTAYLANRVVLEALSGIAWRRRRQAGQSPRRPESPLLEGR